MHRTIKIDNTSYCASIGALDNCRVTIKDGEITVSPDLAGRTPGAEFEAVFYGRERVEIITAPAPNQESGDDSYEIGPLEFDEDETPLTLAKRAKLSGIAAERWLEEVGGIVIQDIRMYTDRESQAKYTGAVVILQATGQFPPAWKGMDGWLSLSSADDLMALTGAVAQFVDGLFVKERSLSEQITAAETVEAVEVIVWG
jgi:hypothetical protein